MSDTTAPETRRAIFHFFDDTQLKLEWPRQVADDSKELVTALREAASAEQFVAEVEGRLIVIQMRNVKYLELIPVPGRLPREWLRGAREVRD